MPLLKRVTGDLNGAQLTSYYDSGDTSNAALLRNLSGTGLAFVQSSDFDFATDALGYVQCDKGASLTFRVNNASEFLTADYDASADASDYWVSFWIRGVVLSGEAPQAGQSVTALAFQGDNQLQTRFVTRVNDAREGFAITFVNASSLTSTIAALLFTGSPNNNVHFQPIAWNAWHKITLHYRRGAGSSGAGLAQVFVNGRAVAQATAFDGSAAQLGYGSGTNRNISLPALSNVQWQLAAPIESWEGRDIALRPMYERDGAGRTVLKHFCSWHVALPGVTQGRDWEASGTGTVTPTSYPTSGTNPARSRLVLAGNGDTPVVTTIESLGGPYYRDGWQTVAFADICVPNGCTGKIELLNAANDAAVVTLNIVSGELRQDSTKLLDWSMPGTPSDTNQSRHTLFLHLAADGQASITLHRHNLSAATAQNTWGASLPAGWIPQSLGKLRFTATTTARNVELGHVGIGFEFGVAGIDSLSTGNYTSTIQELRYPSALSRGFTSLQDRHLVPGGNWPHRFAGAPRNFIFAAFGQSGLRRTLYTTNILAGLTHARNLRFYAFDLGSVNDIAAINTNDPTTIATQIVTQFKDFLDVVLPLGNRAWVTTMLTRDRTGQATLVSQELAGIELANDLLRQNLPAWNTAGRITFSDIHKDYADNRGEYPTGDAMWVDDLHPSSSIATLAGDGVAETSRRMIQIAMIPRLRVLSQRNRATPGVSRRLPRILLGR